MIFFFQAEDGIRDLVRSRGLGDVYKRQATGSETRDSMASSCTFGLAAWAFVSPIASGSAAGVSYTHLTLPTSDLV